MIILIMINLWLQLVRDSPSLTVVQLLFTSSSPLHLNNVLDISQKLLFTFQLCHNKFVSIDFFPWHFQVKDLSTRAILLHGKNENNVYNISCLPSHSQSHHIHYHTSLSTWHSFFRASRFSHPSSCT